MIREAAERRLKFMLSVDGVDLDDEQVADDLAQRLPDVHWQQVDGQVQAIVVTADASLVVAAQRAAAGVAAVAPGSVVDVADDLVSLEGIARRAGFAVPFVRELYRGERGPGGFPQPFDRSARAPMWDWAPVNDWLQEHYTLGEPYRLLTRDQTEQLRRRIAGTGNRGR